MSTKHLTSGSQTVFRAVSRGSAAIFPNDELQFYRILEEVALIVTYNKLANNELYS
jgi:hypothetical protein